MNTRMQKSKKVGKKSPYNPFTQILFHVTRISLHIQMQASRGYTPINQGPLFDDDPGIMSEVETASTGFRRGGKQRSSLPVVRTPSKTLERPLGMVSHIAPYLEICKIV